MRSVVKDGDRVRVTCGESVIVGTVENALTEGIVIVVDGDRSRFFPMRNWTVEVLAPPIPDVVGTIVRDRDGDAWQRNVEFWLCTGSTYYKYTLADVQFRYGPLTVLWTPEAAS